MIRIEFRCEGEDGVVELASSLRALAAGLEAHGPLVGKFLDCGIRIHPKAHVTAMLQEAEDIEPVDHLEAQVGDYIA